MYPHADGANCLGKEGRTIPAGCVCTDPGKVCGMASTDVAFNNMMDVGKTNLFCTECKFEWGACVMLVAVQQTELEKNRRVARGKDMRTNPKQAERARQDRFLKVSSHLFVFPKTETQYCRNEKFFR